MVAYQAYQTERGSWVIDKPTRWTLYQNSLPVLSRALLAEVDAHVEKNMKAGDTYQEFGINGEPGELFTYEQMVQQWQHARNFRLGLDNPDTGNVQ